MVPGIGYADEDVGVDEHLADCAEILVENRVVKQSEASRFQVCWQSPILRHPDLQEHSNDGRWHAVSRGPVVSFGGLSFERWVVSRAG